VCAIEPPAMADAPSGCPTLGNRGAGEEDPATKESEIMDIENDKAFTILEGGAPGPGAGWRDAEDGVMNGKYYQETTGPTDSYAATSQVDLLHPDRMRREEQKECLEALDKQEAEWKEKAIKELDKRYLQKTKANNRAAEEAFVHDIEELSPERAAQLCDFNPKSSKQAKDISRRRSVLISLERGPLVQ
ncbi:hypothetical protein K5549_020706, partial [Capra hircus]